MSRAFLCGRVRYAVLVAIIPSLIAANRKPRDYTSTTAYKVAQHEEDRYTNMTLVKNVESNDFCVQAGIVAAAYLQADAMKDYEYWKGIEHKDCDFARKMMEP